MTRSIFFFSFISLFVLVGCSNFERRHPTDTFPLKFINIRRNGTKIDTIYKQLNSVYFKDSVYSLSYDELHFGDTINRSFEFPISNSRQTFGVLKDTSEYRLKFIGLKYIEYDAKVYVVYKYLFDMPEGDDEEMNFFFVPEFGIVLLRSAAWGSYERLINTSDSKVFDDIFYLNEQIIGNIDSFYFPYK